MNFRPDIEGLRAVAIGLVVAAHAELSGFQAGFIGVDIFFVISGYLITGLLLQQWQATGHIDMANFYARRLIRLLPALLVMVVSVTALCLWMLPLYVQMSESLPAATAVLWVSNLHFAHAGIDYFGAGAEPSVFLHTWSLGVEEQFYLVWPLILLVLLHGAGPGKIAIPKRIPWLLAVLALIGLIGTALLTKFDAKLAFYMMPARAWQFALGGLVFTLSGWENKFDANIPWKSIASWTGASILFLSMSVVNDAVVYPGLWAALPSSAAALLLWGGAGTHGHEGWIQYVLRHPVSQFIGKVSYGWYLWHWPLLILAPIIFPVSIQAGRIVAVTASLVMATVSHLALEQPIRRSRIFQGKSLIVIGASMVITLGLAASLLSLDLYSESVPEKSEPPYKIEFPVIYKQDCDDWHHSDALKSCIFGNPDAPRTAYLVGDSIGVQWFPAINKIFNAPAWRLIVYTKSSCPIAEHSFHYSRLGREYRECDVWRQRVLDRIAQDKPDLVIFGSSHQSQLGQTGWTEGTRKVLAGITPATNHIVILQSTPLLPFNGAICANSKWRRFDESRNCSYPSSDNERESVAAWIAEAALPYSNAHVIDMTDLICPQGICHSVMNGQLVFRDQQHLDGAFVIYLSPLLHGKLNAAFPGLAPEFQTPAQATWNEPRSRELK